MTEISPHGQELKEVYESANSHYWVNVASPLITFWAESGQDPEQKPDVMTLMAKARDFAWDAVAHRAESWSK